MRGPQAAGSGRLRRAFAVAAGPILVALVACKAATPAPPAPASTLGGTVSGLAGTGLVLHSSLGEDLPIAADGPFAFSVGAPRGSGYEITVGSQPRAPSQLCTVRDGSGRSGADVVFASVTCTTRTFTVSVEVTGLTGSGLVLRQNGGDDLAIPRGGRYTFATPVGSGAGYAVTVAAQPASPSQTCTATSATGAVADADVSVSVVCAARAFPVNVTVSGLAGSGLVLRQNGADDLAIPRDGAYAFATPVASGATYAVTVAAQPGSPSQTCTAADAAGPVAGAPISVSVTCVARAFTIGVSVTGLVGGGLVLRQGGGDDLPVAQDGSLTFAAPVPSGAPYAVTVARQPDAVDALCSVHGGTGTVDAAAVTVQVACTVRGWSRTATRLDTDAGDVSGWPALVMNAAGNGVVAWSQVAGASPSIRAARFLVGAGWGPPELLETGDAGPATAPQAALNAAGSAVVVWQQSDGAHTHLWASRASPGAGWTAPEPVEADVVDALAPAVGMDAEGNVVVVWGRAGGDVRASRWTAAGGWSPAVSVAANSTQSAEPRLAVNGAGDAVAVWTFTASTRTHLQSSRLLADGRWSPPALVETDELHRTAAPRLAIAPAGDAVAVWHQANDAGFNDVWAGRLPAAGTAWEQPVMLNGPTSEGAVLPQVAVGPSGEAVATWFEYDRDGQPAVSSRYSAGSWGPPQRLAAGSFSVSGTAVALDPAGEAMAVLAGGLDLHAARWRSAAGWGTPQLLEGEARYTDTPAVVVDAAGNAIAAWRQTETSPGGSSPWVYHLWVNRYQ